MLALGSLGLALATAHGALATEAESLPAWLAQNTDLKSSHIALVDGGAVYSLEPLGAPLPTGEVLVLVRTEALAESWGVSHGFLSWDGNLLVDCPQRQLRVIRSATYPKRNRAGTPAPGAETFDPMTPLRGAPAARLVAAACDTDFAWPLRAAPAAQRRAEATTTIPATIIPAAVVQTSVSPARSATTIAANDRAPLPGGWVLQVARGGSEEGANRATVAARKALGSGAKSITGWTVSAPETYGAPEYAALIGRFGSFVQASEACEILRRARQDCLVRRALDQPFSPPAVGENATIASATPSQEAPRDAHAVGAAFAVQVARGPSEEGARRAMARARKSLGNLDHPLREAMPVSRVPGDHLRYDARLEGFPTAEVAGAACRKLAAEGQDCFVVQPETSPSA